MCRSKQRPGRAGGGSKDAPGSFALEAQEAAGSHRKWSGRRDRLLPGASNPRRPTPMRSPANSNEEA